MRDGGGSGGIIWTSHTPEGGSLFFAFFCGQVSDRYRAGIGLVSDNPTALLQKNTWTGMGQI